jgi:hypothetical protein
MQEPRGFFCFSHSDFFTANPVSLQSLLPPACHPHPVPILWCESPAFGFNEPIPDLSGGCQRQGIFGVEMKVPIEKIHVEVGLRGVLQASGIVRALHNASLSEMKKLHHSAVHGVAQVVGNRIISRTRHRKPRKTLRKTLWKTLRSRADCNETTLLPIGADRTAAIQVVFCPRQVGQSTPKPNESNRLRTTGGDPPVPPVPCVLRQSTRPPGGHRRFLLGAYCAERRLHDQDHAQASGETPDTKGRSSEGSFVGTGHTGGEGKGRLAGEDSCVCLMGLEAFGMRQ